MPRTNQYTSPQRTNETQLEAISIELQRWKTRYAYRSNAIGHPRWRRHAIVLESTRVYFYTNIVLINQAIQYNYHSIGYRVFYYDTRGLLLLAFLLSSTLLFASGKLHLSPNVGFPPKLNPQSSEMLFLFFCFSFGLHF